MANSPIDTSGTHYISALCTGGCGAYVVAAADYHGQPLCLECRRTGEEIDWEWFAPLGEWHPTLGYPAPGSSGRVSDGQNTDFRPAEYEIGPNLTPFAEVDPDREMCCLQCRERWPMVVGLTGEDMVAGFHAHDRVAHEDGVWLIGGPGGADEPVCAPCGGGAHDKRALPDGPDHSQCLKGKVRGWSGRCGCKHRSRDELDAIVGKNRRNWRPNRWSDPEIVDFAAKTVQNRWDQLNLWEGQA